MQSFTKALIALAIVGVLIGGGVWIGESHKASTGPESQNVGGGFTQGEPAYITSAGAGSSMQVGEPKATSTVAYMSTTATASTTVQGSLGRARALSINVQATGTSSPAVLNWAVDVSNDGIDWFNYDVATTSAPTNTVANQVFHSGFETTNIWPVATSTATGNTLRKQFLVKDLIGKYFRVRFGTSGANQSIWVQAIPLEETPN